VGRSGTQINRTAPVGQPALLAVLAAAAFVTERSSKRRIEAYYWVVIILIRTGATNIADYLAFRVRVPAVALTLAPVALLCAFAWRTHRTSFAEGESSEALPKTDAFYWIAMLTAGVFGTVMGDICEHTVGEGVACIALSALLFAVLITGRGRGAQSIPLYWSTIAVARTAGTAIGDWLAENKFLNIGLPLSTLATGMFFVTVLVFWRTRTREARGVIACAEA
jgi:uncharacterized membrane-anchored protein